MIIVVSVIAKKIIIIKKKECVYVLYLVLLFPRFVVPTVPENEIVVALSRATGIRHVLSTSKNQNKADVVEGTGVGECENKGGREEKLATQGRNNKGKGNVWDSIHTQTLTIVSGGGVGGVVGC
jgi:hypothetical protein